MDATDGLPVSRRTRAGRRVRRLGLWAVAAAAVATAGLLLLAGRDELAVIAAVAAGLAAGFRSASPPCAGCSRPATASSASPGP